MNGGYIIVDMQGLDFDSIPTGPVAGIHEKTAVAFGTGKLILLKNLSFGGAPMSPAVSTVIKAGTSYVVSTSEIKCRIDSNDTITVVH